MAIPILTGIWAKIVTVAAAILGVVSVIFYALWKKNSAELTVTEKDLENAKVDVAEASRINKENEVVTSKEKESREEAKDVEEKMNAVDVKHADKMKNAKPSDDPLPDEIKFGGD